MLQSIMILLAETLDLLGVVMVAYTAIAVHHRVWKEHKMDANVFKAMKHERVIGIPGIGLIILSYILKIPYLI